MLSNFHGPEILDAGIGVLRKKRDKDGKRERHKMDVPCPAQTKDYCNTSHLIDKGNGAEASYDLGGKSRLHNWSPKLVFWLFNMALNNAYKMYTALVKERRPERRFLPMGDAVRELMHDLCQKGSGDAEVEGGASELDSRYGEVVWVGDRLEGLVRRKGNDDGDAGVSAGGCADG